jgi:hypothetical protein
MGERGRGTEKVEGGREPLITAIANLMNSFICKIFNFSLKTLLAKRFFFLCYKEMVVAHIMGVHGVCTHNVGLKSVCTYGVGAHGVGVHILGVHYAQRGSTLRGRARH